MDWAAEHLRIIRTLMDRVAIYRRALRPTSLMAGSTGIAGAVAGSLLNLSSPVTFLSFWIAVGVLTAVGAIILIRKEALQANEPFWSPPAKRVAQAALPGLVAGALATVVALTVPWAGSSVGGWIPGLWMVAYGCAVHAAGFFMPRGIRLLGWIFVGGGALTLLVFPHFTERIANPYQLGHAIMGVGFGGIHLAYGLYLKATEPRQHEP